jgi:MYXO-CTERM domain-containing protein
VAFNAVCMAAAIGMNVHLPPSDTLDLAQDLGSEWIRIDFNWDIAEPQQGQFDWAPFDAVIDAAKARNLKVFATIGYTPAWASTGDTQSDGATNDVPDAAAYASFVKTAAARYADGRVAAWGTWNEPNLSGFFEGSMQQWIDSAFAPAVDAIEQGCPSCLVVGPELATVSNQYQAYLEAALVSRGPKLDALSWHIYADFPEDDAQAGLTKDSFYNKLDAHRVVTVAGVVVYEGPQSVREVLLAQGYSNLPVWVTETGYEAAVDNPTNLEAQRKYVEHVMAAQDSRPWWQRTFVYELSEEHPGGAWPNIHWGLALRVADPDATFADNFQLKPAFTDLKNCIATSPTGTGGSAGGGAGTPSGGASGGAAGGASGASAGAPSSGGTSAGGTGASGGSDSGGSGAQSAAPAGAGDSSGCGCATPGKAPPAGALVTLLLALSAWVSRRQSATRRR